MEAVADHVMGDDLLAKPEHFAAGGQYNDRLARQKKSQ